MRNHAIVLVTCLSLLPYGCGGSSESPPPEPPPAQNPTAPVAVNTPLKIAAEDGESLAEGLMFHMEMAHLLSLMLPAVLPGAPGEIDETFAGVYGGLMTFRGRANANGAGRFEADIKSIRMPGYQAGRQLVFRGKATIDYRAPAEPGMVNATITTEEIVVTLPSPHGKSVLRGSMDAQVLGHLVDLDIDFSDTRDGTTWRSENLVLRERIGADEDLSTVAVTGRFIRDDEGYLDVSTPQRLVLFGYDSELPVLKGPGEIRMSGAGGTSALATFLPGHSEMVFGAFGVDTDGDGFVESTNRFDRGHAVDYTAGGIRSLPIAVGVMQGSDEGPVSLGQSVTLDARFSIAEPGSLLTYHWSLWQSPAGSEAELSGVHNAHLEFTPDSAGLYVFAVHAHDGSKTAMDLVRLHVVDGDSDLPSTYRNDISSLGSDFSVDPGSMLVLPRVMNGSKWTRQIDIDSPGFYDIENTRIAADARPHFTVAAPLSGEVMAVEDFDGDGLADMLMFHAETSARFEVAYNKGGGRAKRVNVVFSYPVEFGFVDDVNSDGLKDLVFLVEPSRSHGKQLEIHLADEDGNFSLAQTIPVGFSCEQPGMFLLPDGERQLLVKCHDVYQAWSWEGSAFAVSDNPAGGALVSQFVQFDFDGDGLIDLINLDRPDFSTRILTFLKGNPDGTFSEWMREESTTFRAIHSADLNADGKPDLVISRNDNDPYLSILIQRPEGGFDSAQDIRLILEDEDRSAARSFRDITFADLNDDGRPDILISTDNGVVLIFQDADGRYPQWRMFNTAVHERNGSLNRIFHADVNGDGYPDLVHHGGNISFGTGTP